MFILAKLIIVYINQLFALLTKLIIYFQLKDFKFNFDSPWLLLDSDYHSRLAFFKIFQIFKLIILNYSFN
jgi:hypothetical protein